MNPKELRVGNLFHEINRNTEVHLPNTSIVWGITAIPSYGVEAVVLGEIPAQVEHHNVIEFYNLSPIPLTVEWLYRFGFKARNGIYTLDKSAELGHPFSNFSVGFYDDTQRNCWRGGREVGIVPMQYVHQLQNLFHALTGQELTIKEQP